MAPVSGGAPGQRAGKAANEVADDGAQMASFARELAGQVDTSEDEPLRGHAGPAKTADFITTSDGIVTECPMGQKADSMRAESGKGGGPASTWKLASGASSRAGARQP